MGRQHHQPSPRNFLREHTTNNRTDPTCNCPDPTDDAEICTTGAKAEQIANNDVDERQQASTTNALNRPSGDEHPNIDRECGDETADHKHYIGHEQDWLAPEDI